MGTGGAFHHGIGPFTPPVRVVYTPIRSVERVHRDDVSRQCSKRLERVDRLPRRPEFLESRRNLLQQLADQWLHAGDGLFREVRA